MFGHVLFTAICTCFCVLRSSAGEKSPNLYFSNLIEEGSLREAECDATIISVNHEETTSFVDPVPRLHGKWVSQGCEIRRGPKYLIRSLSFSGNLTFKFIKYHYNDISCTSPSYSILAEGHIALHNPSWTSSGAKESRITIKKLSVIKYANSPEVTQEINQMCPGFLQKRLKLYKELNLISKDPAIKSCPNAFAEDLKELSLLRTQARMVNGRRMNELLTGSDFSDHVLTVLDFRPLFNTPLISGGQRHGCNRCHNIVRSSGHAPPILMAIPRLPPFLMGEWVSQRCEALPLGVFLTRRLSFGLNPSSWALKASYHSDSSCMTPTFTIFAKGTYQKGGEENPSQVVDGAFELDMTMLNAHVEIRDRTLREALQNGGCGEEKWNSKFAFEKNDPKCSPIAISVPVLSQSLVRLELDLEGSPLLYLGQPTKQDQRSTSFLPPLTQCSSLPPLSPQALVSSSYKVTSSLSINLVLAFLLKVGIQWKI